MTVKSQTPIELVKSVYSNLEDRLSSGRKALGRPLTLAEKILINHLENPTSTEMNRGVSYVDLHPDRVAMQDATGKIYLNNTIKKTCRGLLPLLDLLVSHC